MLVKLTLANEQPEKEEALETESLRDGRYLTGSQQMKWRSTFGKRCFQGPVEFTPIFGATNLFYFCCQMFVNSCISHRA